MPYLFLTGFIGLELYNGSNESAHLEDSVNLIVNTATELIEAGMNFTDTPENCSRRMNKKWEQGINLLE